MAIYELGIDPHKKTGDTCSCTGEAFGLPQRLQHEHAYLEWRKDFKIEETFCRLMFELGERYSKEFKDLQVGDTLRIINVGSHAAHRHFHAEVYSAAAGFAVEVKTSYEAIDPLAAIKGYLVKVAIDNVASTESISPAAANGLMTGLGGATELQTVSVTKTVSIPVPSSIDLVITAMPIAPVNHPRIRFVASWDVVAQDAYGSRHTTPAQMAR